MLVIAHRGASAEAPENTIAAICRALDAKADGIEIDLYEVDGELFVFHDRYLERLTAHPGRLIDLTAAQIRKLKIFSQHAVPTLDEVLETINGQCMLNIELKGEVRHSELQNAFDRAQTVYNFSQEQLIVSSFNHHWLKDMKQRCSWLQIGALSANCMLDYAAFASQLNAYSLHTCVDFVNQELINDAHQRGLSVFVYTVDQAQDIKWLKKMGVDGIFTNHPQLTRNVLAGLNIDRNEIMWHR